MGYKHVMRTYFMNKITKQSKPKTVTTIVKKTEYMKRFLFILEG